MYFVGLCLYLCAMVEDLVITLNDLDKDLYDELTESASQISYREALVNNIQFHNEIIE